MTGVLDIVLGLVQLLAVGLVIAVIAGTLATRWKLLHPRRRTYADAVRQGRPGDPSEIDESRDFETVRIEAGTGDRPRSVVAWVIDGDAKVDEGGRVIVYAHGWASSKMSVLPRLGVYAEHAAKIVSVDLPGHGESLGPVTLGCGEPVVLADVVRWACARFEVGVERVVLAGSSMGGGSAIAAAAIAESQAGGAIGGVIGEGVYRLAWTPARNVLRLSGKPWRITGRLAIWSVGVTGGVGPRFRGFDRAAWAARVRGPLLVVHGTEDEISPLEDGESIVRAKGGGATIERVEGARHHELWSDEYAAHTAAAVGTWLGEQRGEMGAGR